MTDITEAIETLQYLRSEAMRQSEISVWFVTDMCDQALEQLQCHAVTDVSDGPYGEPYASSFCPLPTGHPGSCQ